MKAFSIANEIIEICKNAKKASYAFAMSSGGIRRDAVNNMAQELIKIKDQLLRENKKDVADAVKNGLFAPFIKRLTVDEKVFDYMVKKIKEAAEMDDPLGRIITSYAMPDGLTAKKVSVPLGVIGMIYESRPNVTTDASAVCIKSGNAVILRGGSESVRSNILLADAMRIALKKTGLPEDLIQMIKTSDHEAVDVLLKQEKYVDVLIPRGGRDLIRKIAEGTRIPTIKHYEGICHIYIAKDAPLDMAVEVSVNSKCQSVEVCNALEKILIDKDIAEKVLPALADAFKKMNVEIRACERSRKIMNELKSASEEDWITEYLAPVLTVKIVDGVEDAAYHINTYGSHHTDGIIASDKKIIEKFVSMTDSASVMVNASTRLSGGGEFGFGAAVGISTDKLHVRGPVGINDLTSYKWIVYGKGHVKK